MKRSPGVATPGLATDGPIEPGFSNCLPLAVENSPWPTGAGGIILSCPRTVPGCTATPEVSARGSTMNTSRETTRTLRRLENMPAQERCSRDSLKQPPVELPRSLRSVMGLALKERFEGLGAVVVCVAVSRQRIHLLVKTPVGQARAWTGIAKCHAWFVLRGHGWVGKLWGKRSKEISLTDRAHQ